MADACSSIFEEDQVCLPTSSGGFKYGRVVESSEYISSDEEDDEYENRVQKGTVKVAWHPLGDETVVAENRLILTDRALMPGDVVRRLISEKDSQRGFVESILSKCHVKILGTEQWIYNVDVADISNLQGWDTECVVILDSWVGQLYEIIEDVTVKFPDGARCILRDAGQLDLEDNNDRRDCHSEFFMGNFYPGQELIGSWEDYKSAEWLNTTRMRGPDALGAKPLYEVPVIVEKVEVSGVDVHWLCKGFKKKGNEKDALESPPRHVKGDYLKCLKMMDCFEHCHYQIGDKGYYVVKETDTILCGMSPRQHYTPDVIQNMSSDSVTVIGTRKDGFVIARKGENKDKKVEEGNGLMKNGSGAESQIVDNDFDDNDGNDELDNDVDEEDDGEEDKNNSANTGSHGIAGSRNRRKRAFLRGGKSLKKLRGRQPKKRLKLPERIVNPGDKVPVEIYYIFSTCRVMWQDGTAEDNIPSPDLFPIHHLDEFEYFPGDFVVDAKGSSSTDYGVVVSCDHRERTCMVRWMKPYFPGKSQRPEEGETTEVSVYDIKDHPDYKFRPGNTVIRVGGFEDSSEELEAAGVVYKLDSDGMVHIWWPNNTITKTYPQDLFLIYDDMSGVNSSDDWTEDGEEESEEESDASWETEDEESTDTDSEDNEEESKKESQNKPVWTCDYGKKKDIDTLLLRLQSAISGLLDVFLNVSGPFFKNSKQVFQDILEIFKKCKEMEKLLKTSFFKEEEISNLISEIKEELRKENTTKLAKHVASCYQYRNSDCFTEVNNKAEKDERKINGSLKTVMESDKEKTQIGPSENELDSKCPDETIACIPDMPVHSGREKTLDGVQQVTKDGEATNIEMAAGAVGDSTKKEDSAEQKWKKALIDYGTHIDDPILQIIFDTALHLAVASSAEKQPEERNSSGNIVNKDKPAENGAKSIDINKKDTNSNAFSNAQNIQTDKGSSDESVTDIVESAILSVCSDDCVNAELTALKNSAKRRVEEMYSQAFGNSVGMQTDSGVTATGNKTDSFSGESSIPVSSQSNKSGEVKSEFNTEDHDSAKGDDDKRIVSSVEMSDLPSNHRNLCIRICKALNTRLYDMRQDLSRKWLAYRLGCDENAPDREIHEKLRAKMLETIEKNGRPLSLLDLPGGEKETNSDEKIKPEDLKDSQKDEKYLVSKPVNKTDADDEETEDAAGGNESQKTEGSSGFELCSSVSSSHWFKFQEQKPNNPKSFNTAVRKELMLLQTSLPEGILVKAFEDRMDLYSVMIYGPAKTPYEDGLFTFDVQLPANFPQSPPVFHYVSYCSERLNPNLYEDGKVCVSLLGTWSGKGNEVWTSKSSLLQVLVSIQGLILVSEPYFNEAGYEKQRGTQHGQENSRMYNEMALLKLVQMMTKMAVTPPAMFVQETKDHLYKNGLRLIQRLESWIDQSINQGQTNEAGKQPETSHKSHDLLPQSYDQSCDGGKEATAATLPDFPLLPASRGFCLTLRKYLDKFKVVLKENIHTEDHSDY